MADEAAAVEAVRQTSIESSNAIDRLASIFVSDVILATQFNDMRRAAAGEEPIHRLLLAVLEDGIRCFQGAICVGGGDWKYAPTHRMRLQREAAEWIFDVESNAPFSFNWICDSLRLGAAYLRERLGRDGGESQLPRRAPAVSGVHKGPLAGGSAA